MTIGFVSRSISTKVWHWTGTESVTPGSAVGLSTDYAAGPGKYTSECFKAKKVFIFQF